MRFSSTYIQDLEDTINNVPHIERLFQSSVLVTGASGLIGSAVVDCLLWLNQYKQAGIRVYAAGRNQEALRQRFLQSGLRLDNCYIVEYDLMKQNQWDFSVDYIIHGASNADPLKYAKEPVETLVGNIKGLDNIFRYAIKNETKRMLYISSSEVYGNKSDGSLYQEDAYYSVDILNPRSCYPSAKRSAETLCACYGKQYDMDCVIVRPGHIYGPTMTQTDSRASAQFVRQVLKGESIVMKSAGQQKRSYCYVFDCVSALLTVLLKGVRNQAYNIGNEDSNVTIRQFAEELSRQTKLELKFENPDELEKSGYNLMENSALETKKLMNLGWHGRYTLEEGIHRTLQALMEVE